MESVFSSDTLDADRDGRYDYVNYELPDEGEAWNNWLYTGEYQVGVHIPEGTYTVKIFEGDCTIVVQDNYNGVFLWQQMASEEEEEEDSVIEIDDLRLYDGAIVRIDGNTYLDMTTENAQPIEGYMQNPLTEDVEIANEQTLTAGVDFPEGVYDVIAGPGGGYLEFEVPVEEGEEYSPYYIGSVWLYDESGTDTRFKNLVIPAGVQVSLYGYVTDSTVMLRPSERIGSEDYEGYYLNY